MPNLSVTPFISPAPFLSKIKLISDRYFFSKKRFCFNSLENVCVSIHIYPTMCFRRISNSFIKIVLCNMITPVDPDVITLFFLKYLAAQCNKFCTKAWILSRKFHIWNLLSSKLFLLWEAIFSLFLFDSNNVFEEMKIC